MLWHSNRGSEAWYAYVGHTWTIQRDVQHEMLCALCTCIQNNTWKCLLAHSQFHWVISLSYLTCFYGSKKMQYELFSRPSSPNKSEHHNDRLLCLARHYWHKCFYRWSPRNVAINCQVADFWEMHLEQVPEHTLKPLWFRFQKMKLINQVEKRITCL